MENNDILKALGSMTEEQKTALAQLLAPQKEVKKATYETVRAQKVYFFKQLFVHETISEKRKDNSIIKEIRELPPRVIAVDDKGAWRLYWKQRNKFQFLGASDGTTWRDSRNAGSNVAESQASEYEAMLKNPDMTPPESREKTFFSGNSLTAVSRGQEVSWGDGMRQNKSI